MKNALTLAVMAMAGFALIGCEASGRVGDPDDNDAAVTAQQTERTTRYERDDDGDMERTETTVTVEEGR